MTDRGAWAFAGTDKSSVIYETITTNDVDGVSVWKVATSLKEKTLIAGILSTDVLQELIYRRRFTCFLDVMSSSPELQKVVPKGWEEVAVRSSTKVALSAGLDDVLRQFSLLK